MLTPTATTMLVPSTRQQIVKAQWIRAADVFIIGPLMIAGGLSLKRQSSLAGVVLAGAGVATMIYNGRNYLLNESRVQ